MRVLIRPDWAGDFTIKRTRHTAEQIIRKLKTAEQLIAQGKTVADVCRVIAVTQPTYHRWRQQYGGMLARRLTKLEKENARLQERYRASQRRICRLVGQHRSTQRHPSKDVDLEASKLRHRLGEIAAEHIRWARRMAFRLLWREEGRHHLFQQSYHLNHNLHGQSEQAQKIGDRKRSRQLELEADRDAATMLARAGYPARLCEQDLAFMARSIGDASITEPDSTHPGYEERLAAMRAHDDAIEKQPPTAEVSTRVSFSYSRSDNLLTLTPQPR